MIGVIPTPHTPVGKYIDILIHLALTSLRMAFQGWKLSLKLLDRSFVSKSVLQFPEAVPGDVPPGQYRVTTVKQLISAHLPDTIPDPDLIGGL